MNYKEAIDVLETIKDAYPKYELTKKKANMLLPQLQRMDYGRVMKNLAAHVAAKPYPPTIAEIAAYVPAKNDALEKINHWRKEASKVPEATKIRFRRELNKLLKEKVNHGSR